MNLEDAKLIESAQVCTKKDTLVGTRGILPNVGQHGDR